MTEADETRAGRGKARVWGWALFALLVLYTVMIHHGIGPEPQRTKGWYSPTSFLFSAPLVSEMFETLGEAMALFVTPAVLLAIAVFLTNASSLARATAISCVICCACFVYYGIEADRVWTFFHWRASAVFTLMCFAVGFSLAAPLLARSWLRLRWPARIAVYLPFVFGVLAFVRNATGTDPSLQFAISPWPAVPVFGIELGSLFVMVLLTGLALGVGGIAASQGSPGRWWRYAAALAVGTGVPALLLFIGDWLRIFPFHLTGATTAAMAFAAALGIAIAATLGAREPGTLKRRARQLAVGAVLLGIPVLSAQALARYDYYVTREVLARRLTDALATYFDREGIYPDELDDLVTAGDIDAIPKPAIGFSFLYDGKFRYRNFGTSFILEFPAPRWVQCAYTPPYEGEDEGEDENWGVGGYDNPAQGQQYVEGDVYADDEHEADAGAADDADDDAGDETAVAASGSGAADGDSLGEAWSCPSTPPELW